MFCSTSEADLTSQFYIVSDVTDPETLTHQDTSDGDGVGHHKSDQSRIHAVGYQKGRYGSKSSREHEARSQEFEPDSQPSIDRHGRHVTSLISVNSSLGIGDKAFGLAKPLLV